MIQTDIGAYIKPVVGFFPQASGAATINGASIDRNGFYSAVLHGATGAVTGTPTGQTFDLKLQDSADGSTGWADISGAAITQITAVSTAGEINVNLTGAKRYIRAVGTVALTGGTTPTLQVAATVVLGGAVVKPV